MVSTVEKDSEQGSQKGSEKGVSRRCLGRPLGDYDPSGVRPNHPSLWSPPHAHQPGTFCVYAQWPFNFRSANAPETAAVRAVQRPIPV